LKLKPKDNSTDAALDLLSNTVVIVPLSNPDDMAANFGFKKGHGNSARVNG